MARVSLDKISVEYPIYNAGAFSLRNNLVAIGTGGRISAEARHIKSVMALEDVTLELNDGDRLGLVGHNGSGKSTLLRTIAGIYQPVRGSVEVEGRVSTVFGLGAGLQPELSGYDNIIRMSMMLGATRAQAEAAIPDIEDFSELGNFLAMPVRTYSAGMSMRLNFAVATASYPEILLVDEIFGAGDAEFQVKAQKRMNEFVEKASIFILASHSEQLIKKFTKNTVQLRHGRIM